MRYFYTHTGAGNGGSGLKCRNKAPMPDRNMHTKALASPTLITNCRDSATR